MRELTSELPKKRESHPNGTNLGGENLGNVEVHGSVAAGAVYVESVGVQPAQICPLLTLGRPSKEI